MIAWIHYACKFYLFRFISSTYQYKLWKNKFIFWRYRTPHIYVDRDFNDIVIYQCKCLISLLKIIQLFTMWTWNISNYILLWRVCLYRDGSHEMFIHFLHCSLLLHDRMYLLCHLISEHHTSLILPNRCYEIILWDCYHTLFWIRSNVEQVMYVLHDKK